MMKIKKPKLPKGLAYALKTSQIQAALSGVECDCEIVLQYWTPQSGASVLEAEYWVANSNRPTTLYLRAGSLPGAEVAAVRVELERTWLPAFAKWFSSVRALPEGSTQLTNSPRFEVRYQGGHLRPA
jgi:hypothetical protein